MFDELYNERKINEIINSLPILHQTALLVLYLHFSKSDEHNEIEINKLLSEYNNLNHDFMITQDFMNFVQILKYLESYNFISLKQSSKYKNTKLSENLLVKLQISLSDIKNALCENEIFTNYFV